MAVSEHERWLRAAGPRRTNRLAGLLVTLTLLSGCGDDLLIASATSHPTSTSGLTPTTTHSAAAPTSTSVSPTTRVVDTIPSSTTLIDPHASSAECWPEGNDLALATDTTFWTANGDVPYVAEYWPVSVAAGAAIQVSTIDQRADFDDDGIADTVQWFAVATADGLGEGLRVCGTSREMQTYFVGPSNGNFGIVPVVFDNGPDGIINRPTAEDIGPEDALLFTDDGFLLPPYARDPESSSTPAAASTPCFEHRSGETIDTIALVERFDDGWARGHVLRDVDIDEIISYRVGDVDGDGVKDVFQTFWFSGPGDVQGVRVCGTSVPIADWVDMNPNKPVGFEPPGDEATTVRGLVAGGSGIFEFDIEVVDDVLTLTNLELTQPE